MTMRHTKLLSGNAEMHSAIEANRTHYERGARLPTSDIVDVLLREQASKRTTDSGDRPAQPAGTGAISGAIG